MTKKSVERWSDDDVSALLDIYSDDAIQGLLLKAFSNAKMYECISQKLAAIGIVHSAKSCRDKIKKLKQDYKKIKDHNNKTGNGRKDQQVVRSFGCSAWPQILILRYRKDHRF